MNSLRKVNALKNGFLSFKRLSSADSSHMGVESLQRTWDVIISGGGMVGSAMAASLGSSSVLSEKKILLLESSPKTEYAVDPDKYSNRVCALNRNTRQLFEDLNVWQKISSIRQKGVKRMVVWESCSDARISFDHDQMSEDVAHIVENDIILKALDEANQNLPSQVSVLRGAVACDHVMPSGQSELVTVVLKDGVTLKTRLLIGADGVNSLVRKKMDVRYLSWSYDQKGVVATLKLSEPTENTVAWQRFLPTGPIALLPLADDLCSLVWTVSLPMSEKLLQMSEEEFVDAVNSALWAEKDKNSAVESALSGFRKCLASLSLGQQSMRQLPPSILSLESESRASFPLGLGHATEYVAPRVALIGDSAHRVHPLAGQGVNLGFGDVKCLTECLEKSVYDGNCVGSLGALLAYESQRQRHVLPAMFGIDALNKIYGTEFTPIVMARSLGVAALDSLDFIKSKLVRQASS